MVMNLFRLGLGLGLGCLLSFHISTSATIFYGHLAAHVLFMFCLLRVWSALSPSQTALMYSYFYYDDSHERNW